VIVSYCEQLCQQRDPADGLAAGSFEMIVELRVLELGEVEPRGVLHQPHAHPVGEQVAEQALDERRSTRQHLAEHDDADLDGDVTPQVVPVGCPRPRGQDSIYDELADPERRDRHEPAHDAKHQHRRGEAAVRLPDHSEQARDVAERVHPLPPARWLAVACTVAWRAHRDETTYRRMCHAGCCRRSARICSRD